MGSPPTRYPGEAVGALYRAKDRPAINPLIAHVLDREAAMREADFDGRRACPGRSFLAGRADDRRAARRARPGQRAGARRAWNRRASRAEPPDRTCADQGRRHAVGGPFRQQVRPGQPDDRGPCPHRSRRTHRSHPRRRPDEPRRQIDDHRLSRRPAAPVAPWRDSARGDRGRARLRPRHARERGRRGAARARISRLHIMRRARGCASKRARRRATRRRSTSAGAWRAQPARASTSRRPAISPRRRRPVQPFARARRVRRGDDRGRANSDAWPGRGDQRSAAPRGRAPLRSCEFCIDNCSAACKIASDIARSGNSFWKPERHERAFELG